MLADTLAFTRRCAALPKDATSLSLSGRATVPLHQYLAAFDGITYKNFFPQTGHGSVLGVKAE